MKLTATGQTLGATIGGLDLSKELGKEELEAVINALGQYGVVRFPSQQFTGIELKKFSSQLGDLEINVANSFSEPGHPEVMILSNIVENGRPIGLADAGQDWHTDLSYSRQIAFANVLYGIKIPRRAGKPLGSTDFCNMHAAYEGLSDILKKELDGKTVLHDFNKFWEKMRSREGSRRAPLTEAQR
ncbi:MAG: TauD/TfdA family dioxygenase, partial [Betaproteobacteria bacterium]|nr:TauD/TfdA family dioxygenase [Betaproteobacteria bacterium]